MLSRLDLVMVYTLPVFLFSAAPLLVDFDNVSGLAVALGILVGFAVYMVVAFMLQMVVAYTALQTHRGNSPSIGDSFAWSLQHALPWLWMITLVTLAVFGGFMLLIIPGIIASVYLLFAYYTFIDDDARGMDALERSRQLVYGDWWGVFGRLIGLGLLLILVSIPVMIVVGVIDSMVVSGAGTVAMVASIFVQSLFGGIITVMMTYGLVQLYDALKNKQKPAVGSGRTMYTVFAVLGLLPFVALAFAVPPMINAVQEAEQNGGFNLDIDIDDMAEEGQMSAQEQAELEAFLEQFEGELDSY